MLELLPHLMAAPIVALLALIVASRRPPTPLWPVLFFYLTSALLFVIGDGILRVADDWTWLQVGVSTRYSGSTFAAVGCWVLAIRYAEAEGQPFEWARREWIRIPIVASLLAWGAVITNPWHGQFLTPALGQPPIHRWMWYGVAGLGYLQVMGSVALYAALASSTRDCKIRQNALIMSGGILFSVAANVLAQTTSIALPTDPTVGALGLSSALFLFGAYRTRLFGLLPVALARVIDHEADGIVLVDPEGRRLYSNDAANALLGADAQQPLPRDVIEQIALQLRDEEGREIAPSVLSRQLLSELPDPGGLLGPCRTPDSRYLDLTSTPIPDRRGRTIAHSLRFHDVTTLRQADERVRDAETQRELEQRLQQTRRLDSLAVLAAGIAHDFNNALSVILGNARLAQRELDSPAQLTRRLGRIENASSFAVDLTNQIMTTAGKYSLRLEHTDLSQLVASMLGSLRASISPKCALDCELTEDLSAIAADAGQLRQLLTSLVINASEAMSDRGGQIEIRTLEARIDERELARSRGAPDLAAGEYVVLEVSDTGPGMDEATRNRAFEPFFTTRSPGRGLGLATSRGIAKSHGAAIMLEAAPERGCRVRIAFPVTGVSASELFRNHSERRSASATRSSTVLVVDDDPAVLELCTSFLERAGFNVISANDGGDALRALEDHRAEIDVVVLDLEMPGLDGEATFRELQIRKQELQVIVVSGYGLELARERFAITRDAFAFLAKPYEPEELVAKVSDALDATSSP